MHVLKSLLLGAFVFACLVQVGHAADYEPFIGAYEGDVTSTIDGSEVRRDLSVNIEGIKNGFRVTWQTTTIRPDGREKSKSYTIDFFPSQREHIYSSAMKANLFGGREPLDPMKGDPYVWAHINNGTMTVHALIVTEDGGYEMQTYERTLVEGGLALKFDRIRNGEPLREIRAMLTRVD